MPSNTRLRTIFHLVGVVAVLMCLISRAGAQNEGDKKRAAAHYKQGRAFYDAGVYDKALVEFQAAYDIAPRALLLYHMGRAQQGLGELAAALELYQRFLVDDPDNAAADDARTQVALLTKTLGEAERARLAEEDRAAEAEQARLAKEALLVEEARQKEEARRKEEDERARSGSPESVASAPVADLGAADHEQAREDSEQDPRRAKRKRRPLWIVAGVAAILAGVALDLLPDSASNGTAQPLDFVPVGLYGLGAAGLVVGVF